MNNISVVIMDLDNTLYDWVHMWYESFNAMLLELVRISGIPQRDLEVEIRKIHQKHGSSEYSFLLQELPSLLDGDNEDKVTEKYDSAIKAYRIARRKNLYLYPTVMETLRFLKERECLLVAYTESKAFYTNYRIRYLELDGMIQFVYSPPDHSIDEDRKSNARFFPSTHYNLKHTHHRFTREGEMKPNPEILMEIVNEINADIHQTIYIGDSLMKDVAMAQKCNIIDIHAKYGVAQHKEEYELLRRVSHWTDRDVQIDKTIHETGLSYPPSYVLCDSFSEILNHFNFVKYRGTL